MLITNIFNNPDSVHRYNSNDNIIKYNNNNNYSINVNVTDTILWQGHHDRVMQLN